LPSQWGATELKGETLHSTGLEEEGILGPQKLTSQSGQVMNTSTRVTGYVSASKANTHSISFLEMKLRE